MGEYESLWDNYKYWVGLSICGIQVVCMCVYGYMRIRACLWEPIEGYGYGT